jgi:hypothetical protein
VTEWAGRLLEVWHDESRWHLDLIVAVGILLFCQQGVFCVLQFLIGRILLDNCRTPKYLPPDLPQFSSL